MWFDLYNFKIVFVLICLSFVFVESILKCEVFDQTLLGTFDVQKVSLDWVLTKIYRRKTFAYILSELRREQIWYDVHNMECVILNLVLISDFLNTHHKRVNCRIFLLLSWSRVIWAMYQILHQAVSFLRNTKFPSLLARSLMYLGYIWLRPSAKELLSNELFKSCTPSKSLAKSCYTMFQCPGLRCEELEVPQYTEDIKITGRVSSLF